MDDKLKDLLRDLLERGGKSNVKELLIAEYIPKIKAVTNE